MATDLNWPLQGTERAVSLWWNLTVRFWNTVIKFSPTKTTCAYISNSQKQVPTCCAPLHICWSKCLFGYCLIYAFLSKDSQGYNIIWEDMLWCVCSLLLHPAISFLFIKTVPWFCLLFLLQGSLRNFPGTPLQESLMHGLGLLQAWYEGCRKAFLP